MDHDQRFKALIREFFAEFMQLFLLLLYLKPRSARKLEFLRLFCDINLSIPSVTLRFESRFLRMIRMIRPDVAKWEQTTNDLRRLATESAHVRTRERFLALYTIALGQSNATLWAEQIDRCDDCVMSGIHKYNERGPDAMIDCRTGGSVPFLRPKWSSRSSKPSGKVSRTHTASPAEDGR